MLCAMTIVDRGRKVTRSGALHGRDLGGESTQNGRACEGQVQPEGLKAVGTSLGPAL